MNNRRQPKSLSTAALQFLIKLVQSHHTTCQNDSQLSSLRQYLTIPPNLFDCFADGLLSVSSKEQIKSSVVHNLVFGSALTRINLDDFPSLPGFNVAALHLLLANCTNLKVLISRYTPFFWTSSDIHLFQQSFLHLKNLQSLTLCNMDLSNNPTFLKVVGTHCPVIKEMDLSHSQIPALMHLDFTEENFPFLEILVLKQKSEEFRTFGKKEVVQILKQIAKLRILDDDTGTWSCVLPALHQLNCDNYTKPFALIENITIYQTCTDLAPEYVRSVERIKIDGRAFRRIRPLDPTVSDWIPQTFPNLRSIDIRLENIGFPIIQDFLTGSGKMIHSLYLSSMPLSTHQFQIIGEYAPNLRKLEVVNQSPLDISNIHSIRLQGHNDPCAKYFRQLEFLSYTGVWDESLASLLLDHSIHLKELHLKAHSLPVQFLSRNPLTDLMRLVLDLSFVMMWSASVLFVYDMELDFVQRVIQKASSLREIRLKSRPTKEWESLQEHLKSSNFDLQILRPI